MLDLKLKINAQEKVYREMREVFYDDDSANVEMHHCVKLKYMEQCIKETLRLFSLVPVTIRTCPESIKISGEYHISCLKKVEACDVTRRTGIRYAIGTYI